MILHHEFDTTNLTASLSGEEPLRLSVSAQGLFVFFGSANSIEEDSV